MNDELLQLWESIIIKQSAAPPDAAKLQALKFHQALFDDLLSGDIVFEPLLDENGRDLLAQITTLVEMIRGANRALAAFGPDSPACERFVQDKKRLRHYLELIAKRGGLGKDGARPPRTPFFHLFLTN
jgi:uncharacterized protein YgfB (UPF0149 family)